jgi:hypothetical protein
VRVTDWLLATLEVAALKVVEEDPPGIVVEMGTVTAALLLDRAMTAPPAGAGPESVTVQVLGVPPWTIAELHISEDKLGPAVGPDTVIVPPVPATVSAVPVGSPPNVLVKEMVAVDATLAKVTEATTPLEIMLEFIPVRTHIYDPPVSLHVSDFPAAEAAAPAAAFTDATPDAG